MKKLLFIFFLLLILACAKLPVECQNISELPDQDYCLLELALNQTNVDYCSLIKNSNWETWCFTDLAEQTNNKDICMNLEGSFQEHCIKNVAISLNDVNVCESIVGTAAGDECYRMIAVNSIDGDICFNVVDVDQKNRCYSDVAVINYEQELCSKISFDVEQKDTCFFKIAMRNNATEACSKIFVKERREACYVNRAVADVDWDICGYIDDDNVRSSCEAIVNHVSSGA